MKSLELSFLRERGFTRIQCKKCGEVFWTLDPDREICGEAPCVPLEFVGKPPAPSKSLDEIREAFLSFFEEKGHTRIAPFPTVARWREDVFFTHASIINFQPYVTEGVAEPPANPLVISQPCLRFVDIEDVGATAGRHLTAFEMGGHHAFNKPDRYVYWEYETLAYHHEFVTRKLGIPEEEVIYKEGFWSGGGNAGPDVESIVRGLEVATLVFMQYKVLDGKFVELPVKTVDTGYGMERFTWLLSGKPSAFPAIYGSFYNKLLNILQIKEPKDSIFVEALKLSSILSKDKLGKREGYLVIARQLGVSVDTIIQLLRPMELAWIVIDHTKSLLFLLTEGILPSNAGCGYVARLLVRRILRALDELGVPDVFFEILEFQGEFWKSLLGWDSRVRDRVLECLKIEKDKYEELKKRGTKIIAKLAKRVASGRPITKDDFVRLYESHGLVPEFVAHELARYNIKVAPPEDIHSLLASRHLEAKPSERRPAPPLDTTKYPKTRLLFYEDPDLLEFEARVVAVGDRWVVLDQTAFYAEKGGQASDTGVLRYENRSVHIRHVEDFDGVLVHWTDEAPPFREGGFVVGCVDGERRMALRRHHTATHLLLGVLRQILGDHVWQMGARKEPEYAHLDVSHYRRITPEEISLIEETVNELILRNIPVRIYIMDRYTAQMKYGTRIFQGGAPPGRNLRIVEVEGVDVEACGGLHVTSTGQIGFFRIERVERIQENVVRFIFRAGLPAVKLSVHQARVLEQAARLLGSGTEEVFDSIKRVMEKAERYEHRYRMFMRGVARYIALNLMKEVEEVDGYRVIGATLPLGDLDFLAEVTNRVLELEADVVIVGSLEGVVVVAVSDKVQDKVSAAELAKQIGSDIGGGGGGRRHFAQARGKGDQVNSAISRALEHLKKALR